jgi:hypothetical protein
MLYLARHCMDALIDPAAFYWEEPARDQGGQMAQTDRNTSVER